MYLRLAVVLLALGLTARPARACTCSSGGARAAFRSKSAVFLGRVVGLGAERPGRWGAERTARLRVTRSLKGVRGADTVVVAFPAASCAPGFAADSTFLVYATAS